MLSTAVLFALVSAAFAAPGTQKRGGGHAAHTTVTVTAPASAPTHISQCNTGSASCCNTVQSSDDSDTAGLLGLLGVALQGVTAQVGLGCTPISVIGVGGGANCAQQPVCCENNQFNGLINIGCSPISL